MFEWVGILLIGLLGYSCIGWGKWFIVGKGVVIKVGLVFILLWKVVKFFGRLLSWKGKLFVLNKVFCW